MEKPIIHKHEYQPQVIKKCNECNRRREILNKDHQMCHVCYKYGPSGNKVIDDFIRYTQINHVKKHGKMEFVPYEQFINVKYIAEGGFSKIYKATWIDGPVINYKRIKEAIRDQIIQLF
jgi:hypothetical protein